MLKEEEKDYFVDHVKLVIIRSIAKEHPGAYLDIDFIEKTADKKINEYMARKKFPVSKSSPRF